MKALIITGEGPKFFAAGADIKEMADQTYQEVSTSPLHNTRHSCMRTRPQLQQIPMFVTALMHCLAYLRSERMLKHFLIIDTCRRLTCTSASLTIALMSCKEHSLCAASGQACRKRLLEG